MSAPIALAADARALEWASLPLRQAQRVFALLLEDAGSDAPSHAEIHLARLRSQARRTLSTLSADDQANVARWLALQFASRDVEAWPQPWVARVDAALAAGIEGLRAAARETVSTRAGHGAVAA